MTQDYTKLTARMEKLERQNRWLKLGGLGVAGLLGTVTMMSMAGPLCDTVSAERFVLRDSRGKTRMMMDAYHTEPSISFKNHKGKTVASFGVDESGEAYLTFTDKKGKLRGNLLENKPHEAHQKSKAEDEDASIAMR